MSKLLMVNYKDFSSHTKGHTKNDEPQSAIVM